MQYKAFLQATAFFLIGSSEAHLFMSSPKPIEGNNDKTPLDATGKDFPCHGTALTGLTSGQSMAAGSSQVLAFEFGGGDSYAVHGGGSCQLSLTYETDPAKVKDPKNWKVIHSIIGGCPSNTYQTLDGQYTGPAGSYTGAIPCSDPKANGVDCVNQFNYTIPQDAKNGNAILAWTWFNTVGNREMYMNCAAVDISGGKSDDSGMSSLPSMFVANLASFGQCGTTQSTNLVFPNPGTSVETKTAAGPAAQTAKSFPNATPGPECGAASGFPAPAASVSSAPAPTSAPSSPAAPAAPAPTTSAANGTGGASTVTVPVTATVTASAGAASSSAPAATASGAAPAAAGASGSVTCSTDGALVCIGTNQFGICGHGKAVPQALAAGTRCSDGKILRRSVHQPHVREFRIRD